MIMMDCLSASRAVAQTAVMNRGQPRDGLASAWKQFVAGSIACLAYPNSRV